MGILVAFVMALLVSLLFIPYKKREAGALVILFLVLFLSALAAQYWVVPFGPMLWGVTWLPMLFVVFIFGLLFSSPSPLKTKTTSDAKASTEQAAGTLTAISIFIWLLFCILLLAIVLGLFHSNVGAKKPSEHIKTLHIKPFYL